MSESVEFDPVEWITAGAVGEPGARTFYLQAEAEGRTVALVVEKQQVRMLANLAQELLARVEVTVMPDDLDEAAQRLREPVEPWWRVGPLRLGIDEAQGRFLLEAEELVAEDEDDPAMARLWMSREQLAGMAAYAAFAVEAGARERCRFCERPIDPVAGHVCPATNGHGPLTA